MAILARLLRKQNLDTLQRRATDLLGSGWRILVSDMEGRIVHPPGGGHAPLSDMGLLTLPLHLDKVPVGQAILAPPPDALPEAAGVAKKVLAFFSTSVEEILTRENIRRVLAAETLQKYRELSLLHRATLTLNQSLRPRDVAQALLAEFLSGDIPADGGIIYLRKAGTTQFLPQRSFGASRKCGMEQIAGSTLFLDVVKSGKPEIINDLASDKRWHGEAPGLTAMLIAPLLSASQCVGVLVLGACGAPRFDANHLQYVGTIASVAGIAMGNALHFESVQLLIKSLMQALATAIDARDPFTAGHSQRVARLSVALAKAVHENQDIFPNVRFTDNDLQEIIYAGLLHDVGKIGIREQVLTKSSRLPKDRLDIIGQRLALWSDVTGGAWREDFAALARINGSDGITRDDAALIGRIAKNEIVTNGRVLPMLTDEEMQTLLIPRGNLTQEERREIERHPSESYRILQHIPFPENMRRLLTIISQHHERLDGSGYPSGLRGDDILLQSRIIAIVDIYDAITMERHYKPALPRNKALAVLRHEAAEGKIDSDLVRLFAEKNDEIEEDAMRMAMHTDNEDYLPETPGHAEEECS
ncbi:GAF domain-containing protein [Desulfovibrio sulfodismutans]|uniref:GAF domain-containing protein n=1 Tax=Desulfolutivibrio sulfodismutans TaxID=63561 RepID=A0A7K3NQ55_9BACT|nr:HD domain-containing phosphohydrolase [Desulfolutivibrio sulfodismutans]NDY57339.1 GAF domain-containing protein [Desulfolutivibrio sulfodismutans]QLA13525.1 GAF domain-containing protein [Desulfolutivibrio sulfodismutans DSM 3696]